MGLGAHLRQHWVGWFTTAVSIVLAAYFYLQTIQTRDPVFLVDPDRTEIISRARVETAPIRVLRQDGRPVTGDLYAMRFYFWNAGQLSVRPLNVLDTIVITLSGAAEMVDFKVLSRTRPITGVDLRPHRVGQRLNKLILTFVILEHDDGFSSQIIYEGSRDTRLSIAGTIEGVPAGIRDGSSFGLMDVIRYSQNGWWMPVGGLVVAFLFWGIGSLVRDVVRWSSRPPEPAPTSPPVPGERRQRPTTRGDLVALTIFLLFFVAGVTIALFSNYRSLQEEARLRSVSSVPRSVLP